MFRLMKRLFPTLCLYVLLATAGPALSADPSTPPARLAQDVPLSDAERVARDEWREDKRGDKAADKSERRQSRLSPEERKALRQQINEAGQDLYPAKRAPQ